MPEMIEMVVDSVRVSLTNQQRIIALKEKAAERFLPIWIGPYEAEAITLALQELEVARPQTHDLIRNILAGLKARLMRVEVTSLREDVYYGNLVIEVNEEIVMVDSRPSDALALAVRYHVPSSWLWKYWNRLPSFPRTISRTGELSKGRRQWLKIPLTAPTVFRYSRIFSSSLMKTNPNRPPSTLNPLRRMTNERYASPGGKVRALLATQPHSRESEEAVLGAVLINPEVYFDIAQILRPNDSTSFATAGSGKPSPACMIDSSPSIP